MGGGYDAHRDDAAERSRAKSAAGREVGPLPPVVDPERKELCADDLRLYLETYHAPTFRLAWGRDHLRAIATIQDTILAGGQYALAMPRGTGKTSLLERAALWAMLYGHRRYVVLVGATEPRALSLLDSIKCEVAFNDLVAEDFPAVCYLVRRLEGLTLRARGQTLGGEPTRIGWGQGEAVFPAVPGAASSAAAVEAVGITGSLRGLSRTAPGGGKVRPDLVLADDPQTDESARSPTQVRDRLAVMNGAILGLAGPGQKIAAFAAVTVIRPRDAAHQLLDRAVSPEWRGHTCRLLDAMPADLDLWREYAELLRAGLRAEPPDRTPATEFYRSRRAAMDKGAEATWPERYEPGQLSAVQNAMDLYLLKPRVFAAEYQNDPDDDEGRDPGADPINPEAVAARINRVPRGKLAPEVSRLTAFIDVGQEVFFWCVVGWAEDFGGHVVDYGTYPGQPAHDFAAADPPRPLSRELPGRPLEARLYAALETIAGDVLGRDWPRAGRGDPLRVERCLVDSGWQPDVVHQWARQTRFAAQVTASKGQYVGAAKTPFSEWRLQPGDRVGPGWRLRSAHQRGKLVLFDANHWKSWLAERSRTAAGAPGCLYLFGERPHAHELFAAHLAAERPVRVSSGGRTVDEWQALPGRPDNHWLDCLVGSAVAASVAGLRWSPGGAPEAAPEPVSLRDLQAQERRRKKGR